MGSQKDSSIAANTIKDSEGTINIAIARPVAKGTRINSLPTPELEKAPPEGVEVGGIWGTIEYFGPMSIFLVCFVCLTICFGVFSCDCDCDRGCNEDKKPGYFIDGLVYDKNGRLVGAVESLDFKLLKNER